MQEQSDLLEEELQCPVFESKPMTPLTTEASDQNKEEEQKRLISCPICFSVHPVEQIEEHANSCSMWLLDDTNDQCDIPDSSPTLNCNAEPATAEELTGVQHKKVLSEQIATLSAQLLSTDVKCLTIRRKFIWQISNRLWQPRSNLNQCLKLFSQGSQLQMMVVQGESYFQVNDCSLLFL